MKNTFTTLLVVISIFLISCDKPACSNNNPVFNAHAPSAGPYKAELAKQLAKADRNELRYWVHSYKEANGQKYMLVDITGETICAVAEIEIGPEDRQLDNFVRAKGQSYGGAELEGLEFYTKNDDAGTHFKFKEFIRVID